jgi:hypothetical protein
MARSAARRLVSGRSPWPLFLFLLILILILQVAYGLWVLHSFGEPAPKDMAPRGQFGDTFGTVNAFFTGAAFAGVIVTVLVQGRELREATNLGALTALANAYGTRLAPYWASQTALKLELARAEGDLASAREDLTGLGVGRTREQLRHRVSELGERRKALKEQLLMLEKEWGFTLGQQEELVSKLDGMVKEAQES